MKKRVEHKRFNVSLPVPVLKALDKMAAETNNSRSGFLADMIMLLQSIDENKELGILMTNMVRKVLKVK